MTKETSKCYDSRLSKGYFDKYLIGNGIDIGGGDDCLHVPNGSVFCYDKTQGDAQYLSNLEDNSFDFVYSSHCLEHMINPILALTHWIRICKPNKYLHIVVPEENLYEKLIWPSKWNDDHKWSFTLNEKKLLKSINIYQFLSEFKDIVDVIEVFENFQNYDYNKPHSMDQTFKFEDMVCCQIEFILRKK